MIRCPPAPADSCHRNASTHATIKAIVTIGLMLEGLSSFSGITRTLRERDAEQPADAERHGSSRATERNLPQR